MGRRQSPGGCQFSDTHLNKLFGLITQISTIFVAVNYHQPFKHFKRFFWYTFVQIKFQNYIKMSIFKLKKKKQLMVNLKIIKAM